MEYELPRLVEINMDAEVGTYQDDFSDEPREPIAEPEAEASERE